MYSDGQASDVEPKCPEDLVGNAEDFPLKNGHCNSFVTVDLLARNSQSHIKEK